MTKKQKPLTDRQRKANIADYEKREKARHAELERWEKLVAEKKATAYFKPTRFKHSSGYRVFEIGYVENALQRGKTAKKIVLGVCSDHLYQDYGSLIGYGRNANLNFDCTMEGYIRFWSHEAPIIWERMPLSSTAMTTPELQGHRRKLREKRAKEGGISTDFV